MQTLFQTQMRKYFRAWSVRAYALRWTLTNFGN